MSLQTFYLASTLLLVPGWGVLLVLLAARGRLRPLTTRDLTTLALVICLLYVVLLPFRGGLAKVPGLDALAFSIPYTVVLLLGLRLVPKPGAAASIVLGQALLGQLLGAGLNPVMLPYHLWIALAAEGYLALVGHRLTRLRDALTMACLRGAVAYGYSYAILAPLVWRKHYAAWYVATKIGMGLLGCVIGAVLAQRLAPRIEEAAENPMG